MTNTPSTSLLNILSLYTGLRRSGSSEREAQAKLRGLVRQLSLLDRLELINTLSDWESQHGREVDQSASAKTNYRATAVMAPGAAQLYGESDYDQISSTNSDTALKPLRRIVSCPSCGKKNDSAKMTCAYCGKPLESAVILRTSNHVESTWFGPHSVLVLTINAARHPLEIPVRSVVTFGRHTPDEKLADIDLTDYRAIEYGVSRLHASIKREIDTLTLTDLQSRNHTFVNGNQLKADEACTLKNGDRLRLGNLGFTITFKHP